MTNNTEEIKPFVEYDGNLYGEVIHVRTPTDHKNYQMYVSLFGDGSDNQEKWDEIP